MLTNVYTPRLGGVTRNIQTFAEQYRRRGHRVLIVAPTFEGQPQDETDVLRFPAMPQLHAAFAPAELRDRMHAPGLLEGESLADAYRAMNVFAFASRSETQGMVLAEAMAAGVPVVALSAPGVRDVVEDGHNGSLFQAAEADQLADRLDDFLQLPAARRREMQQAARETAERLSAARCAERALELYDVVIRRMDSESEAEKDSAVARFLDYEWNAWSKLIEVFGSVQSGRGSA